MSSQQIVLTVKQLRFVWFSFLPSTFVSLRRHVFLKPFHVYHGALFQRFWNFKMKLNTCLNTGDKVPSVWHIANVKFSFDSMMPVLFKEKE